MKNRMKKTMKQAVMIACAMLVVSGCQTPVTQSEEQARNCAPTEAIEILLATTEASATGARMQLMSGIGNDACLDEQDLIALLDTATASMDADPILLFDSEL